MQPQFQTPSRVERVFNRLFGALVRLGGGLGHNRVLQVRGRKSGKLYETPVNLLEYQGKRFLVAPRGETQWVRNVRAEPTVVLKRGRRSESYRVRLVPVEQRAELLAVYLDRFPATVQRYFTVQRGADREDFAAIAHQHPVFELEPLSG